MLRFDEIVFGPIHSRRLGSSLGINLLPHDGKLCNFDCVYCECGWNADGRPHEKLPSAAMVAEALDAKLRQCVKDGVSVDSITFSGHGEPTLHPEFAAIVDVTVALRNELMPSAKVSVLSNATQLSKDEVFKALRKVDNPILKIDAGFTGNARAINRPSDSGYSLEHIVECMERFDGDFVLQTMFLKPLDASENLPDFEADAAQLEAWKNIVRRLHPRQVMVYTLDRPAPDAALEKLPFSTIQSLLQDLKEEKFNIQINA